MFVVFRHFKHPLPAPDAEQTNQLIHVTGLLNPMLMAAVGANIGVTWHSYLMGWSYTVGMTLFFGQASVKLLAAFLLPVLVVVSE